MTRLTLEIDGKPTVVFAEKVGSKIWIHHGDLTLDVDESAKSARSKRKGASEASNGDVRSPMPGKITKLSAQEGGVVVLGQPIVVMEAMKMEYTLKAAVAGTIKKFTAQSVSKLGSTNSWPLWRFQNEDSDCRSRTARRSSKRKSFFTPFFKGRIC